jgi:hypothetical protein
LSGGRSMAGGTDGSKTVPSPVVGMRARQAT